MYLVDQCLITPQEGKRISQVRFTLSLALTQLDCLPREEDGGIIAPGIDINS